MLYGNQIPKSVRLFLNKSNTTFEVSLKTNPWDTQFTKYNFYVLAFGYLILMKIVTNHELFCRISDITHIISL